jgi:hypothetical protein
MKLVRGLSDRAPGYSLVYQHAPGKQVLADPDSRFATPLYLCWLSPHRPRTLYYHLWKE